MFLCLEYLYLYYQLYLILLRNWTLLNLVNNFWFIILLTPIDIFSGIFTNIYVFRRYVNSSFYSRMNSIYFHLYTANFKNSFLNLNAIFESHINATGYCSYYNLYFDMYNHLYKKLIFFRIIVSVKSYFFL